jgi:phosphatidylinositol glycan class B
MEPLVSWRVRGPVLALGAAPRVWAAFGDQGVFWPDEIFQSLEQAHRFAFGYGIVPWEFVDGVRSWVFPGLIGLVWRAMAAAGVTQAPALIVTAKLAMVVLSVLGIDWTMQLSARLLRRVSPERGALDGLPALAGVMVAAFPALILFGSKCMTETVSGPAMVGAALLLTRGGQRRALLAGAVMGLAIFVRYQNGVVALSLFALLLLERSVRDARHYAAGAASMALLGGLLDVFTWGGPFHSLVHYARFHAAGRADGWGTEPFVYYLKDTWSWGGPLVLSMAIGLVLAMRHFAREASVVVLYVVVHSLVAHKEYRYITPILPLAAAVASAGWSSARVSPRWAFALALAVGLGFGVRARTMTWHTGEGVNRLLWAAGARTDVCGVVVHRVPWAQTGGFSYLHRDVPMLFLLDRTSAQVANYVIARREFQAPPTYAKIDESREFVLFRRDGGCAPPPKGYSRFALR